jgi:UDP-N-acetylglucosamine:LPS N-acetylglucosamine transferase
VKEQKTVYFAISDTGGGHRSAANAIMEALSLISENSLSTSVCDILKATRFPLLRQAPAIHAYLSNKHLWLYDLFFRKTNTTRRIQVLSDLLYFRIKRHIEEELLSQNPALVVSVHPLVTGLIHRARQARKETWPILTVITDLCNFHASWATSGADYYLVPTLEACCLLRSLNIPQQKIIYTGFPVHPKFLDDGLTKLQACQTLRVRPDLPAVLITGGGAGSGHLYDFIVQLTDNIQNLQLLVVTGKNTALYRQLLPLQPSREHLHLYGFVNNMETLMTASDIILTKAGPGTIMEALVLKKQLIITGAVGLQEVGNIDFVQKNQLGYFCPTPRQALHVISKLLQYPNLPAVKAEIPRNGAFAIAKTICRCLESPLQAINSDHSLWL